MNNQAPSRRAPNHSISVQSTSLLSRARQPVPAPPSSFLLRTIDAPKVDGERKRARDEERRKRGRDKKGVGTPKDKERVGGGRARSRGGDRGADPAIIVAFPTDKVTARRNTSYFLPLTGRVLREKKANNQPPRRRLAVRLPALTGAPRKPVPELHRR